MNYYNFFMLSIDLNIIKDSYILFKLFVGNLFFLVFGLVFFLNLNLVNELFGNLFVF